MAYVPGLSAADRVRSRVGDTDDPPLLNGGEAAYFAAIAAASGDESAAALAAARALLAQIRLRPTVQSAEGVTVDYRDRIPGLVALLRELAPVAGDGETRAATGAHEVEIRWW